MLRVKGLSVYYGDSQALRDVTFKVDKGELVVLVGSNGAGKSTLLKTLSGLLRPAAGEIVFMNRKIGSLRPHRVAEAGISHVPEGRRLFPFMTVTENLELGSYTKEARKQRSKTLEFVFSMFPVLKERRGQLAGTLSGGEQQMLAIARGLMSRPQLLMLDEPSLGLAPILVQKVFSIVKDIHSQVVTVLLVEQNVRSALLLADRAYVLENGSIILEGVGPELLNNEYVKKAYLGI